ncbi:MAG: family 10 glycosylhydrolase [Bacteroidales bacterium]
MKLVSKLILAVMMISSFAVTAKADDYLTPKREMRSAWVATVWSLDWPTTKVTSTGNETQIAAQQKELTTMLDSMQTNNMNAINLQVRSMCDAFYQSSYEPWSSYISGTRGLDPGYDPLTFAVEECHDRGMECHAWVNPYRYTTGTAWSTDLDKELEASGMLLTTGSYKILNPGNADARKRIVDVCREIVANYDIDGILFDDYFYISGTDYTQDEDLYNEYLAEGGTLGQADWRRYNVNQMIADVYNMIQEVKPWVRFGVSPAGVACTDADVASSYGITPSPGSDWQYNDIYSDPIAWISSHTVDFISPQIYWTIGNSTDYSAVAPWWSMVADTFGRHFYSSHSITSLTSSSTAVNSIDVGLTKLEANLINQTLATGPNNGNFDEYADQIIINRESSLDGAPGSIFYSAKYLYKTAPLFSHYLRTSVFTKPALLPAMTWKTGTNPGLVTGLTESNNRLTWNSYDNVRYTVYAVPSTVADADFTPDIEYLLGVSYDTEYEIPADKQSGYKYAVAVLDRMGNEYSAAFAGVTIGQLAAATIVSPSDGDITSDPFTLTWNVVANATSYQVEMSTVADFSSDVYTVETTETSVTTTAIDGMSNGDTLYWRVRSKANNYNDGVSVTSTIVPQILEITYPSNLETGVSVNPNITWIADGQVNYTLEIATSSSFDDSYIEYIAESTTGSCQVPAFTLESYKTYYARVSVTVDGIEKKSNIVTFTTEELAITTPVFAYPKEGGNFYSEDKITFVRQDGVSYYYLELASSSSFPRTKYVETLTDFAYQSAAGGDIKISSSNLEEGTTYYIRATATYNSSEGVSKTDYTDIVSFTYGGTGSGIEDNISETSIQVIGTDNPILKVSIANSADMYAEVYNILGVSQGVLYNGSVTGSVELPLASLSNGIYLIAVNINGVTETVKFIK